MEQTRWIRELEEDPTGAFCLDPYSDSAARAADLDLALPLWRSVSSVSNAPLAVPRPPLDGVERHATLFDPSRARNEIEGGGFQVVPPLPYPSAPGAGAISVDEASRTGSRASRTSLREAWPEDQAASFDRASGVTVDGRRWPCSAGEGPERLVLGCQAEPYSGQERSLRRSRALLTRLLSGAGQSFEEVVVITESPLILEDLEGWIAIDRQRPVLIVIPIPSLDVFRCHRIDPRGTDPRIRLHLASRLALEGLRVRVTISPLIPGLTDDEEDLRRIFEAARDAGVDDVEARTLRVPADRRDEIKTWFASEVAAESLPPSSQEVLDESISTSRRGELSKSTQRHLNEKIARLRMAYGFPAARIGRG